MICFDINLKNKNNKLKNSKSETLKDIEFKCNRLDHMLYVNKYKERALMNDVHANELRFGSKSSLGSGNKRKFDTMSVNNPTPVTLIGIQGGKKSKYC